MKKAFLYLIGIVVVGIVLVGLYIGAGFIKKQFAGNVSPLPTLGNTNAILLQKNDAYRQAEDFRSAGNFSGALSLYEKALESSENYFDEGQIKYKMAISTSSVGDYSSSIKILKSIAANENYNSQARGYSLEELGNLYYRYHDPAITKQIFAEEPYRSILTSSNNDDAVAYRKLYEYAADIFPSALSELRIADWYSREVLTLSKKASPSAADTSLIAADKEIIAERLTLANADIDRMQGNANFLGVIATAANRKAIISGNLTMAGDSTMLPEPELLFHQALDLAATSKSQEGFTRYHYADFLAQAYGEKRKDNIISLLAPFYKTSNYRKLAVFTFFKNEADPANSNHDNLTTLANIDPDFKMLLKELGWKF